MKKLLLALVVCGTAVIATHRAEAATDCVYWRHYYYPDSGLYNTNTNCGLTYFYCSGAIYHQGCETPYYTQYGNAFCTCPYQ